MPNTAKVASLNTFWTKRIWRNAVENAQYIHEYEVRNSQPLITEEVTLQKRNRTSLLQGKFSPRPLTEIWSENTPEFIAPHMPGWDGQRVEPWRLESRHVFWYNLVKAMDLAPFTGQDTTFADWVGAYVDLRAIRSDPADFTRFWLEDVQLEAVPRQWVRWAVNLMQTDRKVTAGNPADGQHSSYLVDCELFLTADAPLVSVLEAVHEDAPFSFAKPLLISGDRAIPIMERLAAAL